MKSSTRKSGSVAKSAAQKAPAPLKAKEYSKALAPLHEELVKLQQWVVHEGLKVCIVFEGRDGAGKGGTIKAITERVSPRVFRVVALPAPTEREKTPDVHPALPAAPAGGRRGRDLRSQLVQPRRRRAGDGLLHRGAGEAVSCRSCRWSRRRSSTRASSCSSTGSRSARRSRRAGSRRASTTGARSGSSRRWTSKSYSRWYDYSRARDDMFAATDTALGAVVRRALRRQEARAAEHHHATC